MGGDTQHHDKIEYEAVLSAEDVARYLERVAAGLRGHELRFEAGDAAVTLDVSSSVKVEFEVKASTSESSIELEMSWPRSGSGGSPDAADFRVLTSGGADLLSDPYANVADTYEDERLGTPAGQLPLPEAPPAVEPGRDVDALYEEAPELPADLAAEDVSEADIERSLEEYPAPDDVFDENAAIAYESRAERAQPDTFITTADGELRDQSDVAPDTALVEPIVEADESMGEASVGGAVSTPAIADDDMDPAAPGGGDEPEREEARDAGSPFSEVTPDEFED
jgi:amphi-Trp domain-containing protein